MLNKADGCDVVPGLHESVRGEWSEDVDLNDGELQRAYTIYHTNYRVVSKLKATTSLEQTRAAVQHLVSIYEDGLKSIENNRTTCVAQSLNRLAVSFFLTYLKEKQSELTKLRTKANPHPKCLIHYSGGYQSYNIWSLSANE